MSASPPSLRQRAFTQYAAWFCAYLLFVILFGAWVRITHSGAGCGSHWPTCNGEILPSHASWETKIEYAHRLTSGLLGLGSLLLVGWSLARRSTLASSRRVIIAALVTLAFVILEALIGAGLVLRSLVADDDSVARAVVIALHLINTLALTAAATLTAWWSAARVEPRRARISEDRRSMLLAVSLLGLILASTTGAITALGDTLFPVTDTGDVLQRVRDDWSTPTHFLVRLRIVHPMLAIGVAGLTWWCATALVARARDEVARRLAQGLRVAIALQVGAGVFNIALAAPGWMQLVHLLLAQAVWMTGVVLLEHHRTVVSPD